MIFDMLGRMTLRQFQVALLVFGLILTGLLTVRRASAMTKAFGREPGVIHEWTSCIIDGVEYHLVVQGTGDQITRASLIPVGVHRRDMKLEWDESTEQWQLELRCKEHPKCVPCQLVFYSSPDRRFTCEEEYWDLARFELGVLQKIERNPDLDPLLRRGIKMLMHEEILPRVVKPRLVPSPSGPPPGDGPAPLP